MAPLSPRELGRAPLRPSPPVFGPDLPARADLELTCAIIQAPPTVPP
uniref:Uncharacterized protein n=1 Tax=Arundo donax TaxID=35708 RepID=A0A0A8Y4U7_ARUDO